MVQLTIQDEQVVELIRQLPSERRRQILMELAADDAGARERRRQEIGAGLRALAKARGVDWDRLTDEQRLEFVDGLVHEDRPCGR